MLIFGYVVALIVPCPLTKFELPTSFTFSILLFAANPLFSACNLPKNSHKKILRDLGPVFAYLGPILPKIMRPIFLKPSVMSPTFYFNLKKSSITKPTPKPYFPTNYWESLWNPGSTNIPLHAVKFSSVYLLYTMCKALIYVPNCDYLALFKRFRPQNTYLLWIKTRNRNRSSKSGTGLCNWTLLQHNNSSPTQPDIYSKNG